MSDHAATEASPPSLSLRVLRGVEITLAGQAAIVLVNLAVTPAIIRGLGPEHYALYTLIWTFMSYLMMLTLGTSLGVQTYTARLMGRPGQPLASLLRRTLAFQLALSGLGAAALWAARSWIAQRFLHGGTVSQASLALASVAAAAPAYFALQFSVNILYGLQRFGAYNLFMFLQSASVPLCAVGLLAVGRGWREIAAAFVAVHVLLAVAALWSVRRTLRPRDAPTGGEGRAEGFVRYCAQSLCAQASWVVTYQGDRLFISSMLPLGQLAYYSVSSGLSQKFNAFLGAVATTAYPMLAELHGQGEEAKIKRLYLKTTELSLFFMLPVVILSFVLIPQFMTIWLGEDFSRLSTWPFRLLVLANLSYLTTYLPYSVAMGRGSPHLSAYVNLAKAALLLAMWPFCIPRWGILGAAMGMLASEVATTPAYIAYIHRRFLNVGWREFWSEACRRPFFAALGPAALGLATHGLIGSWTGMLAFVAAGLFLFFGLGYWALDRDAKKILASWLKSHR